VTPVLQSNLIDDGPTIHSRCCMQTVSSTRNLDDKYITNVMNGGHSCNRRISKLRSTLVSAHQKHKSSYQRV
jgi:hypothetical protein